MAFPLFSVPEHEASRFVGFAGNSIDRQAEKRDDGSLAAALADPAARILLIQAGRALLALDEEKPARPWRSLVDAQVFAVDPAEAVLLGHDAHGPVLAAPFAADVETLPQGFKAIDHRSVYLQGLLDEPDMGALAQASSLLAWNQSHRFCGRCGGATEARAGGYKRRCTACGTEHFPRTDPVVIMLAVRSDQCLMGRGAHFAPGMYSALAGFIEPGETIEAAVRRETLEESGVRLGRVAYHASQPWPFPYSLMIGCFGEALGDEIRRDDAELEDCRWFSREEVREMLAGVHADGLVVPPRAAIAHHLIRYWAEHP
jgi:NAD+ diphosphatase